MRLQEQPPTPSYDSHECLDIAKCHLGAILFPVDVEEKILPCNNDRVTKRVKSRGEWAEFYIKINRQEGDMERRKKRNRKKERREARVEYSSLSEEM